MAYLGEEIKKLGFGFMRPPMIGKKIDIEQAGKMVDMFLERGFTYFDTAYVYLDGESEKALKKVLVDRYPRESFQLATKLSAWQGPKTAEEARNTFFTSLERTGAGFFDYYLLHNLGGARTASFDRFEIWDFLAEQKDRGLIKHLGFSMHDSAEALDKVLTQHPEMEFVQLQINYADWESNKIQSRKCYEVARRHGKPVIIMEPVKGGVLANPPEKVAEIFKRADKDASPASWAIRYAASLDGLITVLSGMSTVEQMRDNISYMERFRPLDDNERQVMAKAQAALNEFPQIPCTDCRYCTKDCPQNIAIPGAFACVNSYHMFRNLLESRSTYAQITQKRAKASACIACKQCEAACPQGIAIVEELKKASKLLEGEAAV